VTKIENKKANKRGALQLLALPFMFPMVSLGIGIFVLVMILLSFFMLGKILGAILIVGALIAMTRGLDPRWAFTIVVLGIFVFWNPFDFATLQIIR